MKSNLPENSFYNIAYGSKKFVFRKGDTVRCGFVENEAHVVRTVVDVYPDKLYASGYAVVILPGFVGFARTNKESVIDSAWLWPHDWLLDKELKFLYSLKTPQDKT